MRHTRAAHLGIAADDHYLKNRSVTARTRERCLAGSHEIDLFARKHGVDLYLRPNCDALLSKFCVSKYFAGGDLGSLRMAIWGWAWVNDAAITKAVSEDPHVAQGLERCLAGSRS